MLLRVFKVFQIKGIHPKQFMEVKQIKQKLKS